MAQRAVKGPDGTIHTFPDDATDAEISAVLNAQPERRKGTERARTWTDTAIDWLPTAGGIIGGIAGAPAGPAGMVAGAALGGAAGEGYKRTAQALRRQVAPSMAEDVKGMATQAVIQGGSELVGAGVAAAAKPLGRMVMQSALKPAVRLTKGAILKGQTPPVVETLLKEGVNVTPRGLDKLTRIIDATDDEISAAVQQVTGQVQPIKVVSKLSETARTFANQVNPASDLEAVSRAGQEFLSTHGPMSVAEAQALKRGTYQQLKNRAYGELKGADIEAQKALARGLKDEIEAEVNASLPGLKGRLGLPGGVNIAEANARQGAAITARDAVAHRVATGRNRDLMGLAGLAVSHPLTFLTVLADRNPAVKSLLARGLYREAANSVKVSPQLVRMAVQAVASTADEGPQ